MFIFAINALKQTRNSLFRNDLSSKIPRFSVFFRVFRVNKWKRRECRVINMSSRVTIFVAFHKPETQTSIPFFNAEHVKHAEELSFFVPFQ